MPRTGSHRRRDGGIGEREGMVGGNGLELQYLLPLLACEENLVGDDERAVAIMGGTGGRATSFVRRHTGSANYVS